MSEKTFLGKEKSNAVFSIGLLERSSDVLYGRDNNIQNLLSLFSLIESIVLYEKTYVFTGSTRLHSEVLGLIPILEEYGVIEEYDSSFLESESEARTDIKEKWKNKIRAIGNIPSTKEISEEETLNRAYYHAFNKDDVMYHNFGPVARELIENYFSEERLIEWKNNITASDVDPDHRFLDWEIMATNLAVAEFMQTMGADYISDAIEQPVIQVGESILLRNNAVQLYNKLSTKFSMKVEGLINSGVPIAIPIPPIVSMVLDRSSSSPESILKEVISLRDEFSEYRLKYMEYQSSMSSPEDMSLGDLINSRQDHVQSVNAAIEMTTEKRFDSRILHELVGGQIKPAGSNESEQIEVSPGVSLSAITKFGLNKWSVSKIQKRASILFDTWNNVLNIKNYHSLIDRKLNLEINKDEYDRYRSYLHAVEGSIGVKR